VVVDKNVSKGSLLPRSVNNNALQNQRESTEKKNSLSELARVKYKKIVEQRRS
jgi:hypothetical protein